ncbi:hypothetical protein MPH47_20835 [Psychrobacillus psychrodurans]|uniref:hypothetical protein n=1 Tax=Psychrobacillus TaxID=1221880 RepID=UPI0008F11229|nr:hypothetical protein [Psychrobacillus psychrodurans]MCK1999637.1 hypothetical protein [Psychrobacillus psychrodurans]MCZ8542237.1 hypothetical protein [Psychrobacillus psychrodurans]SFN27752.1 hypothetical protein SAMN05421832_13114 [Psychrobacillus psychrodurans]
MKINSVSPYQSVSYTKNTNSKTDFNTTNTFSINQSTENEQIAKILQANSSNTWEELSGKYDVRNATFEEIVEISNTLYEAGEISFKEHGVLTFDYGRATNHLKQILAGRTSAGFDMHATSANSDGKRDWIAEYEARASKDFKIGNLIGYQSKMNVLTLLQRLDT